MKKLRFLLFLFVFYIYIYNPIFVIPNFGLVKLLLLASVINFFKKPYVYKRYFNQYRFVFSVTIILILYVHLIVVLNNGNAVTTSYSLFIWLLETFFIPIFFIHTIIPKYKDYGVFNVLIFLASIAGLISCYMLTDQNFTNFVLGNIIRRPDNEYDFWTRDFGIAEGLSSSYGYIQGVMASLCLLYGRWRKEYYLFFFIIVISALINARTGIISVIITLLYLFFKSSVKVKVYFSVGATIIGIVLMSVIADYYDEYAKTLDNVFSFFTSTIDFVFYNEKNDYYASLDQFLQLPDTVSGVIFGQGITLFGAESRDSTDIAYVNQIFIGGLIYLMGLLIIQFYIYRKMLILSTRKYLPILLLIMALLINFKGLDFCISESYSRFVALLFFILLHNRMFDEKIPIFSNERHGIL